MYINSCHLQIVQCFFSYKTFSNTFEFVNQHFEVVWYFPHADVQMSMYKCGFRFMFKHKYCLIFVRS